MHQTMSNLVQKSRKETCPFHDRWDNLQRMLMPRAQLIERELTAARDFAVNLLDFKEEECSEHCTHREIIAGK